MPYERKGTFDFMGLPPEIRELIYDFAFSSDMDYTPITLLKRKGPGMNLRNTSRFVLHESAKVFQPYHRQICLARSDFLEHLHRMIEIAAWVMNRPEESRIMVLMSNSNRLNKSAHPRWANLKCRHRCREFDSYYCDCLEHARCFNCGRWLALALYYDFYVNHLDGVVIPRLARTYRYKQICTIPWTGPADLGKLYPTMDNWSSFGAIWWDFQARRQMWECMNGTSAQVLHDRGPEIPADLLNRLAGLGRSLSRGSSGRVRLPAWYREVTVRYIPWLSLRTERKVIKALNFVRQRVSRRLAAGLWRVLIYQKKRRTPLEILNRAGLPYY